MNLYEKIIQLHPTLKPADFGFRGTIQLQNDGDGDYIKAWNHPTFEKPTDEQLKGN